MNPTGFKMEILTNLKGRKSTTYKFIYYQRPGAWKFIYWRGSPQGRRQPGDQGKATPPSLPCCCHCWQWLSLLCSPEPQVALGGWAATFWGLPLPWALARQLTSEACLHLEHLLGSQHLRLACASDRLWEAGRLRRLGTLEASVQSNPTRLGVGLAMLHTCCSDGA